MDKRIIYQSDDGGVAVIIPTPQALAEWGIDAIYSASQKCLSCTPGLSPVSFNERVVEHVKALTTKRRELQGAQA